MSNGALGARDRGNNYGVDTIDGIDAIDTINAIEGIEDKYNQEDRCCVVLKKRYRI